MCDDAISEYMASNNRNNKLLEINLECGGDIPPRIKVKGIRAQRSSKCEDINEEYCSAKQTSEVSLLLLTFRRYEDKRFTEKIW